MERRSSSGQTRREPNFPEPVVDVVLRLLIRFLLVPIGYLAAVIAGACVILFGSWKFRRRR